MKFASGYYEQEHRFERKGKIDKEALANAVSQTGLDFTPLGTHY
jgi:hypothetical protein